MIQPDEFQAWRWLLFALLLGGTFLIVWLVSRSKQPAGSKPFPLLEVSGATIAAAGWGLAMPESPLAPYLGKPEEIFVPLIVGFAAVVVITAIAKALQTPMLLSDELRARN